MYTGAHGYRDDSRVCRAGSPRQHGTIAGFWRPRGDVFTADPNAPISAVAERAGVGISALYRRYRSKEELLQELSLNGLRRYLDEVEAALGR